MKLLTAIHASFDAWRETCLPMPTAQKEITTSIQKSVACGIYSPRWCGGDGGGANRWHLRLKPRPNCFMLRRVNFLQSRSEYIYIYIIYIMIHCRNLTYWYILYKYQSIPQSAVANLGSIIGPVFSRRFCGLLNIHCKVKQTWQVGPNVMDGPRPVNIYVAHVFHAKIIKNRHFYWFSSKPLGLFYVLCSYP